MKLAGLAEVDAPVEKPDVEGERVLGRGVFSCSRHWKSR
jgi:hypothetical protein